MMGGCMVIAISPEVGSAPALARKVGGAPARLLEKQHKRCSPPPQDRPQQLARKVGGSHTRLLRRQRSLHMS